MVVDGGGWWVVGCVCNVIIMSNPTPLCYFGVVLRLSWGCDNFRPLGPLSLVEVEFVIGCQTQP